MTNLIVFLTFAVFIAAGLLTGWFLEVLKKKQILDHPNHRSSHDLPTPRGGGLVMLMTALPAWAVIAASLGFGAHFALLMLAVFLLGLVSWRDDIRGTHILTRLGTQILAVIIGLYLLEDSGPIFQGFLPFWADRLLAGICWLWFINLFNFMDGIDGLCSVEIMTIGGGMMIVGPLYLGMFGILLAAAAGGFIIWNWQRAKIFMGDIGSIPFGFLLGYLLLTAASDGFWAVALILPLYFYADATATLLQRIWRREKFWAPHNDHYYQKAVKSGLGHGEVTGLILLLNIILIVLAYLTGEGYLWSSLTLSFFFTACWLGYFKKRYDRRRA